MDETKRPLKVVLLGVTNHCNLRCQMCTIWHNSPSYFSRHHQQVLFEDPSFTEDVEYLGITGGEPLLYDDLVEFVGKAIHACHNLRELCITTNGSLPRLLHRYGCQIITECTAMDCECVINISVDGLGPVHDRQRGVPGTFDKVAQSIKIAQDCTADRKGASITLSTVLTRTNADGLMDLFHYAHDKNIRLVISLPMQTDVYYRSDRSGNSFSLLPEQRRKLISLLKKLLLAKKLSSPEDVLSIKHLEHLLTHLCGKHRRISCVFREHAGCLITANGEVFMCGGGDEFRLGHLGEGHLSDLLARSQKVGRISRTEYICQRCPSVCYLQATHNK